MKKSVIVIIVGIFISFFSKSFAVESCCELNSPGNLFMCGPHDNNQERYGNCTWYATYKRPEISPPCLGNASSWFDQAENGGIVVGQNPVAGSIVVFNWYNANNVNIGHVAYVEKVNDDSSFDVTEMGWDSWNCIHSGTYKKNGYDLDGIIGFIYPLHHPVIKFSDSSTVYLKSEVGKLWLILNEQTYILLGYRNEDCVSFVSDWSYVTELPESEKSNYSIMARAIPSRNDYQWNNLIAYKVVEKVGPVSCVSMAIDSSRIYLFGSDNKFHHITNEQVYYDLGYQDDWSEVVEISPDLFLQYGEGDAITEESISSVNPQPSFLGNFDPGPEMPDPIPIVYPPEDLVATIISPTQIDLSWNKGQNPNTDEYDNLRYRAYTSVNNGSYYAISEEIADNSYSLTGLAPDTNYCFKISTYFIGDIENHESDFSDTVCVTIEPETPPLPENECSPPQNMTVSKNNNILTIAWTNNNPQVIDYIIQIWENNGAMLNSLLATTMLLVHEETNLVPGKEYRVIGKTYCPDTLSSDWSEPVFFMTDPALSPVQEFQIMIE